MRVSTRDFTVYDYQTFLSNIKFLAVDYFVVTSFNEYIFQYRVFEMSELFQALRMGWRPFPGAIIIGDQAYKVCIENVIINGNYILKSNRNQ